MNRRASDLTVTSWNAHNRGRGPLDRFVGDSMEHGAAAIVLNEVWRRHRQLERIASRRGLLMLAEQPRNRRAEIVPEHGSTVVLVAPVLRLDHWRIEPLARRWEVVDAKRTHEPRRLVHLFGETGPEADPLPVEVIGSHGPTRSNTVAVDEYLTHLRRSLINSGPNRLSAAVGDHNVRRAEARDWGRPSGFSIDGQGPDLAIVHRGMVRSHLMGTRGSDHYAVRHEITAL